MTTSPTPTLVNEDRDDMASEDAAKNSTGAQSGKPSTSSSPPQHPGTSLASTYSLKPSLAPSLSPYPGSGTPADPYIVDWLPGESENPLNWSKARRFGIVINVACITVCVGFGSSAFGGAISQIMVEFNTSQEIAILGLSLYVLGFACGPLIWAPLSEMYGRRPIHLTTYAAFTLFNVGSACSQSMVQLLICRFFAGLFGSSGLNNTAAVVSDIFDSSSRATAIAVFAAAANGGPVLGPVVGGFVGQSTSWRWIFGVLSMASGTMYVLGAMVKETYFPVLLRKKALRLQRETGQCYISRYDREIKSNETVAQKLAHNITRPLMFLTREMVCFLFSLYAALAYGILYMLFGAFPQVFQVARGWSPGVGSLPFLGVGLGMLAACIYTVWDNRRYQRAIKVRGCPPPPEFRLPILLLAGVLMPVGLFWFAWTVQPSVHWSACLLATLPLGMGIVLSFMGVVNYVVDCYPMYVASALAAGACLRSIFGCVFPLFTRIMFQNLGNNWALTVAAFAAFSLLPIPIIFIKYGPSIRARSSYALGSRRLAAIENARDLRDKDVSKQEGLTEAEDVSRSLSRM